MNHCIRKANALKVNLYFYVPLSYDFFKFSNYKLLVSELNEIGISEKSTKKTRLNIISKLLWFLIYSKRFYASICLVKYTICVWSTLSYLPTYWTSELFPKDYLVFRKNRDFTCTNTVYGVGSLLPCENHYPVSWMWTLLMNGFHPLRVMDVFEQLATD